MGPSKKSVAVVVGVAALTLAQGEGASAAGGAPSPPTGCSLERRPNIVIVLADDLGWADVGFNGSTFYETPNLDRLAAGGMRLTDFYAASNVCSPTRASIMTGRAPARLGIHLPAGHLPPLPDTPESQWQGPAHHRYRYPRGRRYLDPRETTLAEALRDAGYATAHVGKWHLGRRPENGPRAQGFQHAYHANYVSGWGYFSPYRLDPDTEIDGPPGEYLTDRQTDEAIGFIRANRDRPFFVNLAYDAVHGPWEAKAHVVDYFAGKARPGDGQRNPVVAAMIHSLDENVGRLAAALEDLGLAGCTVIAFTSDNGGYVVDRRYLDDEIPIEPILDEHREIIGRAVPRVGNQLALDVPITSNAPLRGGKSAPYEGGIRVPAFIVWPGVVGAGRVSATPAVTTDLFPTLLEAAGVEPPSGVPLDGISLMPMLRADRPLERQALYWYLPLGDESASAVVRQGRWKLIRLFERSDELYDLEGDLGERVDLAGELPGVAGALRDRLLAWLEEVGAEMPRPNPPPGELAADNVASAVVRDGSLRLLVEERGHDTASRAPLIVSGRLDVPGPVALRVRLRSTTAGEARVLWADATGRFRIERVAKFALRGDGDFHTHVIPLDNPEGLGGLRIFLPRSSGEVELDWLRITPPSEHTVLEGWEFGRRGKLRAYGVEV